MPEEKSDIALAFLNKLRLYGKQIHGFGFPW